MEIGDFRLRGGRGEGVPHNPHLPFRVIEFRVKSNGKSVTSAQYPVPS